MFFKRSYLLLLIAQLFILQLSANDTSNLKVGLSLAGAGAHYFLVKDKPNIHQIKEEPIWLNSGLSFALNVDYSKFSYFVCYSSLKRDLTIQYDENYNMRETFHAKSFITSTQIGFDYKFKSTHSFDFYFSGSFIFSNGWFLPSRIDQYNTKTNQATSTISYPDSDYNGKIFSISPGMRMDLNIFKQIIYWRTRLGYAQTMNSPSFPFGTNRILFSTGIGLSYAIE